MGQPWTRQNPDSYRLCQKEQLENVAREIGKDLYILREMDGRFGNEELEDSEIITRAIGKITK